MKPLVSILIPAHNAEKWIADTIRSAVAQSWERKEIIIIDDGSTDYTLGIARQFESESVRVIWQENRGAAAARNKALSLSHGDYIQWLDADDLLAWDKIAKQMEALDRAGSARTLLSSSFGQFTYRVFMQTAVWLVSRELTDAAGPWDTSMISDDDGEYFCRVLLASDGIRFVRDARVYYRSVGTMRLSYVGRSNSKLEALWCSMRLHISYLRSLEDSEKVRAACLKYLQNYLIDFYPLRLDIAEQMHKAAKEMGGQLDPPRLPWKYSWIKTLLGWSWAKRAQLFLPSVKWSLIRFWDRALFRIETRGVARASAGI